MTKQPFSFLAFSLNSLLALMSFVFVDVFYKTNPWTSTGLMMLIGTYYLIIITKFIFLHRKFSMTGAYFLIYTGLALAILFIIWLGSWIISISFHVAHLFSGIYNFIFSLPILVCGIILIIAGALWEHSDSRTTALKNAILLGK
jgi:hypothetical protein